MDLDIRFYDNDEKNWSGDMIQHSPPIQFIEVDNSMPNVFIQTVPINGKPTITNTQKTFNQAYIDIFSSQGNSYAQFLNRVIQNGDKADIKKIIDKDYPSNGFQPYIPDLIVWAQTNNYGQKCVIFDWDKTITAVEGMYFGEHGGESILNHDIMQVGLFAMGGPDRLAQIQRVMTELRSMRVQIYIITNNPNASLRDPSRGVYLALVSIIFGISTEEANSILFSSKDHGYKKWKTSCAIQTIRPYLKSCGADMSISTGKTGIKMSEAVSNLNSVNKLTSTEKKEPSKRTSRKSSTTGYGLFSKKRNKYLKQKSSKNKKVRKTKRNKAK